MSGMAWKELTSLKEISAGNTMPTKIRQTLNTFLTTSTMYAISTFNIRKNTYEMVQCEDVIRANYTTLYVPPTLFHTSKHKKCSTINILILGWFSDIFLKLTNSFIECERSLTMQQDFSQGKQSCKHLKIASLHFKAKWFSANAGTTQADKLKIAVNPVWLKFISKYWQVNERWQIQIFCLHLVDSNDFQGTNIYNPDILKQMQLSRDFHFKTTSYWPILSWCTVKHD